MKITNKNLKKIYIDIINDKEIIPEKKCPQYEILEKTIKNKLRKKKKEEIISHVTQCQSCANYIKFIINLERYESLIVDEINRVVSKKRKKHSKFLAFFKKNILFFKTKLGYVFAFLLLFVIVFSFWKYTLNNKKINLRSNGIKLIELIEPKGVIDLHSPLEFRWNTLFPADYFILEIFNENLILVWKSEKLRSSEGTLPSSIEKRIKNNESYFWMLTAYTKNGIAIESNLIEFRKLK